MPPRQRQGAAGCAARRGRTSARPAPRAYFDACNLNVEHGPAQDVAGVMAVELDSFQFDSLVKVDGFDFLEAILQVTLVKEGVVDRQVAARGKGAPVAQSRAKRAARSFSPAAQLQQGSPVAVTWSRTSLGCSP